MSACVVDVVHVRVVHAAVDVHRPLHFDTLYTVAAFALLGRLLTALPQASIYDRAVVDPCVPAHSVNLRAAEHWPASIRPCILDGGVCVIPVHKPGSASVQRRLTFQWDLWSGRPLDNLDAMLYATWRFLLAAAASLTFSRAYSLR